MDRAQLDQIITLVDRIIGPAGYECIEAEWVGNEHALRLFVDRAGGIDIDGCATVSRLLSEVPELDGMIPGSYMLEVSSPGIERPLRRKAHFERVIGETVQVRLMNKVLDRRNGTGRVVRVSECDEVTLETTQGAWSFPLDQVQKASLVYNWNDQSR